MGNCVGNSGQKAENENRRKAKNNEERSDETTLNSNLQKANKEKMSSEITALKRNNETQMNKDTGKVTEPIQDDSENLTVNGM